MEEPQEMEVPQEIEGSQNMEKKRIFPQHRRLFYTAKSALLTAVCLSKIQLNVILNAPWFIQIETIKYLQNPPTHQSSYCWCYKIRPPKHGNVEKYFHNRKLKLLAKLMSNFTFLSSLLRIENAITRKHLFRSFHTAFIYSNKNILDALYTDMCTILESKLVKYSNFEDILQFIEFLQNAGWYYYSLKFVERISSVYKINSDQIFWNSKLDLEQKTLISNQFQLISLSSYLEYLTPYNARMASKIVDNIQDSLKNLELENLTCENKTILQIDSYNRISNYHYIFDNLSESYELINKSLNLILGAQKCGVKIPNDLVVNSLKNASFIYDKMGYPNVAKDLMEIAVSYIKKTYGTEHLSFADILMQCSLLSTFDNSCYDGKSIYLIAKKVTYAMIIIQPVILGYYWRTCTKLCYSSPYGRPIKPC